ncbi:MAG: PhzF family phenazine biosynthesis protein [Planctomycetota bacterium]|nr:PhzF family phenazine biosynthesis protein [Planctomycetota bacterium]
MAERFWIVDAFADGPFQGNPAAVVLLRSARDDAYLQAVAGEFNLSETAFIESRGDSGQWKLRWFTPACEVDLCGHATLAAGLALFDSKLARERVEFLTRSGPLVVGGDTGSLVMDFPALAYREAPCSQEIAETLGAKPVGVFGSAMDMLVELADAGEVRRLAPRMEQIASWPCRGVIVTAISDTPGVDFVSRFFAPAAGIPEDPVTGSAHCLLGPFWAGRLGRNRLVGRQVSRRPGTVGVEVRGERVHLAGKGTITARGELSA